MQIRHLKFDELTGAQIAAWKALQRQDAATCSPFFRPEFCELVAQVRSDVEVAVLEDGSRIVGFWPFQRDPRNVARPVGSSLCDFQGIVAEPGLVWDPRDVLRQCGLSAWTFDHLITSLDPMRRFHWSYANSPVIDLKAGYHEYCEQKKREKSETVAKTGQKIRKLEREVGPIRFVPHSDDPQVLETVIEWKRDQYRRIRSVDHLAENWARDLLRRIAPFRKEDFAGMLSAVYAGDRLVAAHLGMCCGTVLHGWFPVYNGDFEKYSPGLIFWVLLAQRAAELGIERIDLGKGPERFKQSLKTGDVQVALGAVDLHRANHALRHGLWRTEQLIRQSPLAAPVQYFVRSVRAVSRLGQSSNSTGN